jgi:hypothetical protein
MGTTYSSYGENKILYFNLESKHSENLADVKIVLKGMFWGIPRRL